MARPASIHPDGGLSLLGTSGRPTPTDQLRNRTRAVRGGALLSVRHCRTRAVPVIRYKLTCHSSIPLPTFQTGAVIASAPKVVGRGCGNGRRACTTHTLVHVRRTNHYSTLLHKRKASAIGVCFLGGESGCCRILQPQLSLCLPQRAYYVPRALRDAELCLCHTPKRVS